MAGSPWSNQAVQTFLNIIASGTIFGTLSPPLPGTATGTKSAITSNTLTDIGPTFTVPANFIGTGTTYHVKAILSPVSNNSLIAGTAGLYWGGIGGVNLVNTPPSASFVNDIIIDADLYWLSNTSVSAELYWAEQRGGALAAGSVVTGLVTNVSKVLTIGWQWSAGGTSTVTPAMAYAIQVHL